ncbi:MAG: hypothetical protein AMXMBFR59_42690 [Rhodanobacteraceae bacterium]
MTELRKPFTLAWLPLLFVLSGANASHCPSGYSPNEAQCRQNGGDRWCVPAPAVSGATRAPTPPGLYVRYWLTGYYGGYPEVCQRLQIGGSGWYYRRGGPDWYGAPDSCASGTAVIWRKAPHPGSTTYIEGAWCDAPYVSALGGPYTEYACPAGTLIGQAPDGGGSEMCVGPSVGPCLTYPNNNSFGCGKTVSDLEVVTKAADDPTRVFHQTQTCIARKSCDLRCQMENCKWMDRVIPDFVNPYLKKTGRWPQIEAECRQPPALPGEYGIRIRDRMCARAMAKYHIEVDLNQALFTTGCGSDGDWSLVFEMIKQCIADTFNSIPYLPGSEIVAGVAVHGYREETRARCQYNRQAVGKPAEIDADLGGKQCSQP